MNETKFKAWLPDKKMIVDVVQMNWIDGKVDRIGYIDSKGECEGMTIANYAYTSKFELMQYIGSNDIYGKEIYRGNIIVGKIILASETIIETGEVVFSIELAKYILKYSSRRDW